jgi:predicted DNA-binding WGR domain protein
MRRFELVEGSSSKFWEIAQEGSTYTVCFGRIGTNGQTQTKDLGSDAAAAAAVAKLIAEKTKKGYSEVGGDASVPSTAVADDGAKPAKAKATKAKEATGDASATPAASSAASVGASTSSSVSPSSAAKPTSAAEEEARGPGEPSTALLRLSMPTRRFPHEDPTQAPIELYDALLAEKGLVGVIDELTQGRLSARPFARAFAKASEADFEAARARGIERIAELCAAPAHHTYGAVAAISSLIHQDDPEGLAQVIDFIDAQSSHWVVFQALPLLSFLPDRTRWAKLSRRALSAGLLDSFDPATALVRLGPWVMPELVKLVARGDARLREKVMAAVAASGTSEAASFILDHGDDRLASDALEALMKDPPRAFRSALVTCARSTKHSVARDVLARLLRRDPSLASLATTDPQRAVIASVLAEKEGTAASAIPDVLAKAPWEGRKLGKPIVVAGLVAKETPTEEVWPAGLREKWSALPWSAWASYDPAWRSASVLRNFTGADPSAALSPDQAVEALRRRDGHQSRWVIEYGGESFVMLEAPYAKAFWGAVHPTAWSLNERATRGVVAVLGADALDGMLIRAGMLEPPKREWIGEPRRASALPAVLDALLPIRSSRVAPAVAAGMVHRRARKAAIAWVLAHPETAALGLVPIAVSKPSKERTGAEQALRLLASQGHEDVVSRAASSYGAEAEAAVRAVLATDPLALAKSPKLPAWLDLATLPPLRLHDGSLLPDASRAHVVGMLAASAPDEAYPGLELAKEHLDPESLDELAWALFREWGFAGAPSKESWPFTSLAHAGGDRCVARLAPMVAVWPNDGLAARAQTGVEILGTIGSDAALVALHRFSQKAKTKGLKTAALEKMEEIAEARGLTADELADRLVPDVGLDDAGSLELDLGDRVLTVGFDEHLAPFLREPDGARLTAFPKASKQGDPAKHKEAKARFAQLQKDVKEVAKHVLSRMENAMASGRGWPADVAESCFFTHPLMRHLAGRVAWTAWVDGVAVGSFRVAEDGSPSTPSDDAFALPAKATVTLLHPARASKSELAELGDRFADYELVQPFEQLTRPVFALAKGEGGKTLARFVGKKVSSKRIFTLESHGWTRTIIGRSSKAIGDVTATLQYSPGIDGSPDAWQSDEQTIGELTLEGGTLESLDALAISELLYDVERMFASE